MYISRAVLLLILVVYVFAPTAFSWMINPGGAWYRPYLIWAAIVTVSFVLQLRRPASDDEW